MTATPEQIEQLFTFTVEFAQSMLHDDGAFYPFGVTLAANGEIAGFAGDAGETGNPSSQDILAQVSEGLVRATVYGEAEAVALVSQVAIPVEYGAPTTEGIRVHIETHDFARFIFVPFEAVDGAVTLHDPIAVEVDAGFFATA